MANQQKTKMTMLEYCKVLLSKVSFDQQLIQKEYKKGLKYLSPSDQAELRKWLHLKGQNLDNH